MNVNLVHRVLGAEQLAQLRERLEAGPWLDGRATAGSDASLVKRNLQLDPSARSYAELSQLVTQALQASEPFKQLALPRRVSSPLFSRYDSGMEYGLHTDDAYRSREALRTDLAVTLFLSDPASYDGGALVVGDTKIRAAAGDLVVYPATSVHRVSQVTRGRRLAAVLWVQSLVRDERQRDILAALQQAISHSETPAMALALGHIQQNLLRLWVEP